MYLSIEMLHTFPAGFNPYMNRLKSLPIIAFFIAFSGLTARSEILLQPNDFVALGGDSITDIRRYSVFMEDYLLMCKPVETARLAQFGWGGTMTDHFLKRIDTDILPWHPTVVTTCFGMNDGRYPDGHAKALTPLMADFYRTNLISITEKLKAGGVRVIVLGSPGVVDSYYYKFQVQSPDPNVPIDVLYNKTLGGLADIAKEVAAKEHVYFADVHTPMAEVMPQAKAAYGEKYVFAGGDGIHPKAAGSLVMAYAFLKALGCDGAIGTITVDLASNKAEGTPGQKIISMQNGAVQVESTRYPFCFFGDPNQADDVEATSGIIRFFPFNDELNRYLLVVNGLTCAKAKVTWGSETKEFTSSDLGKGVNLAAEFIKSNPFADQFTKVNLAVEKQQEIDKNLMQGFLPNLASFKLIVPAEKASLFDEVAAAGKDHELDAYKNAASLVIPIQHTIKIEPIP